MTVQMFRQEATADVIRPLGGRMWVLARASETGGAYEVVVAEATAGSDSLPHRHPWEEMYFLLEGTMDVQVGRHVHHAGPGTFVTLPARCVHGFRVTSERARFLHMSIGTGAVDAFVDMQDHLPAEPTVDDLDAVLDVLGRHGIELLALPETAVAAR